MIRRFLPLALLFAFVLFGCDTTEENGEEFPLVNEGNAGFTFGFGNLAAGETASSGPEMQIFSQEIINDDRFEPTDIVSARIDEGSVNMRMDFPFGPENQVIIDEAVLRLSASGVAERVVARGQDLTLAINSTTAPQLLTLNIENADITPYLRQDEFTATLTLDVAEASGADYQFTVTFDVEATVNAVALPPATF